MNNLWDTNFPSKQGGELTFDYQIALGGDDARTLGRDTGAAISSPLVGVIASNFDDSWASSEARSSFVSVANPSVEILHLRQSRGGSGIDVVAQSHAHSVVETNLQFGDLRPTKASTSSFIGEQTEPAVIADNGLPFSIAPGEIRLIHLAFS